MFSLSWVLLILVSLIQFIIDLPGPVNEGVNHFASLLLYVPMFYLHLCRHGRAGRFKMSTNYLSPCYRAKKEENKFLVLSPSDLGHNNTLHWQEIAIIQKFCVYVPVHYAIVRIQPSRSPSIESSTDIWIC